MIDLVSLGYAHDTTLGVWRPSGDTDFGYSDGDEIEERISAVVSAAGDRSVYSAELAAGITDWPSRYHLTARRSNLLRPFVDQLKGPVLEVGAGMGAVSRLLGESGVELLSVEGSARRASIGAARCADLENVCFVVDALQNLPTTVKFETIIVVGVLEYSRVYFGSPTGADPVDEMLNHLRALLTPDGVLYLAIENQLGLKYFAGYPEDHVGRRMWGVEDRYGDDTVVTFGRTELSERLTAAGFTEQDWWYPYPDYKLPTTVVSDRAIGSDLDLLPFLVRSAEAEEQRPDQATISLERAWNAVARNGLAGELANSFLVRAGSTSFADSAALLWHFGRERSAAGARALRVERADGGLRVASEGLVEGSEHPASSRAYVPGSTWHEGLSAVLATSGWDAQSIAGWARGWWSQLVAAAGTDALDAVIDPQLLDAVPRNLIAGRTFVPSGWVDDGPVELGRVLVRGLVDSLASTEARVQGAEHRIRSLVVDIVRRLDADLSLEQLERFSEQEGRFRLRVSGVDDFSTAVAARVRLQRDVEEALAPRPASSSKPAARQPAAPTQSASQRLRRRLAKAPVIGPLGRRVLALRRGSVRH